LATNGRHKSFGLFLAILWGLEGFSLSSVLSVESRNLKSNNNFEFQVAVYLAMHVGGLNLGGYFQFGTYHSQITFPQLFKEK
jgi:hypothetical protein